LNVRDIRKGVNGQGSPRVHTHAHQNGSTDDDNQAVVQDKTYESVQHDFISKGIARDEASKGG
jgi:hypothetical protein